MALVNIELCIKKVLRQLAKLAPPQGIEILSYKRNRGVSILLKEEETVFVREHGYVEEEMTISLDELGKRLKSIVKREFPRSRKVRVYQLEGRHDLDLPRKKL